MHKRCQKTVKMEAMLKGRTALQNMLVLQGRGLSDLSPFASSCNFTYLLA